MKILLIDSDDSYLTTKSEWLKVVFFGKHKVETFKIVGKYEENANINVDDGINKINEVKPGLIIIDVNIPGGLDIVRNLRKLEFKGLIIAFSVAKDDKFFIAGCDYFISKFTDDQEFMEAVKRIIEKSTPKRKSILNIGKMKKGTKYRSH